MDNSIEVAISTPKDQNDQTDLHQKVPLVEGGLSPGLGLSPTFSSPSSTTKTKSIPSPDKDISTKTFTMRQQNAQKLLLQFAKTFITVMESTVWAKSDSDLNGDEEEDEEAGDEFFDQFGNDNSSFAAIGMRTAIGHTWPCLRHQGRSQNQLDQQQHLPLSDEEFAFEKYFPVNKKEEFRSLFISVAFDMFQSYEYQLIMLVREKRKISEIAEDIVLRILDNFKESQRGFNPEYIKPEITPKFLIEQALQHSEPEGITYNSEWSAVEILENPGILIRTKSNDDDNIKGNGSTNNFYQSHWQKNFIGVKKLIGSKYGFRLKLDFETEQGILKHFEKVPNSSVSPLYLKYEYCLEPEVLKVCKDKLLQELVKMDAIKNETGLDTDTTDEDSNPANIKNTRGKDKVKEFQLKLQIQKLEEEKNSDKVMKQVVNLSRRFENLHSKLAQLEQKGVIPSDSGNASEVNRAKASLLRSNYNVRFEVRDENIDEEEDFSFCKAK